MNEEEAAEEIKKKIMKQVEDVLNSKSQMDYFNMHTSKFLKHEYTKQKLYWSTPLEMNMWDTSAFTPQNIFSLPPVPAQNPLTVAQTIRKEWNL